MTLIILIAISYVLGIVPDFIVIKSRNKKIAVIAAKITIVTTFTINALPKVKQIAGIFIPWYFNLVFNHIPSYQNLYEKYVNIDEQSIINIMPAMLILVAVYSAATYCKKVFSEKRFFERKPFTLFLKILEYFKTT